MIRLFLRILVVLMMVCGIALLCAIGLIRIVQRNRKLWHIWKPFSAVIRPIAGGNIRMYALLQHVGRKSGRVYETPLGAWPFDDGFVLALTYGPDCDWCRNVLAAGSCTLKTMGHEYALIRPEIIPLSAAQAAYPWWIRMMLVAIGVQHLLFVSKKSPRR